MAEPSSPLEQLRAFRAELHACCTRRADALVELGDALLCAEAVSSLPHLSLEPVHRRGWGSTYAALASGRVEAERLRALLAGCLPNTDPLVFAVDVTTWPRCDAECSPQRGYYYHPSRHSAGQPIIAGWAFQWICQLSFDRNSWTAPVDALRLHPTQDADQTAARQIRALLARLGGGPMPWFVFDAGDDSAQLTLDLTGERVAVLVRLRSDRCFYADPPHGRLAARADRAATAPSSSWPTRPPGRHRPPPWAARTTSTAPSPSRPGAGCIPSSSAIPATAAEDPGRSCAAPSSASKSNGSRPAPAHRRCCGCGGPAPASST
jgi:DDE superfamily endonuclease